MFSSPWLAPVVVVASLASWAFWLRRRPLLATGGPLRPVPRFQAPEPTGTSAQRRFPRRSGNHVNVCLADADGKVELGPGRVTDRSDGGLCLLTDFPLEVGLIVCVRTVHAPRHASWVRVEVRSCRQREKRWEIGCRFLAKPDWGARVLFG